MGAGTDSWVGIGTLTSLQFYKRGPESRFRVRGFWGFRVQVGNMEVVLGLRLRVSLGGFRVYKRFIGVGPTSCGLAPTTHTNTQTKPHVGCRPRANLCVSFLGADHPSPKKVNLSIMVGFFKRKKLKGYLLSY